MGEASASGLMAAFLQAKWGALLEALPNAFYAHAVLLGAAISQEAQRLAERCGDLMTLSVKADAVAVAAALATASGPQARAADLVIVSDLLRLGEETRLQQFAALAARALPPGGHLALLHWTDDSPFGGSGEAATHAFVSFAQPRLQPIWRKRTPDFRVDILERV